MAPRPDTMLPAAKHPATTAELLILRRDLHLPSRAMSIALITTRGRLRRRRSTATQARCSLPVLPALPSVPLAVH